MCKLISFTTYGAPSTQYSYCIRFFPSVWDLPFKKIASAVVNDAFKKSESEEIAET